MISLSYWPKREDRFIVASLVVLSIQVYAYARRRLMSSISGAVPPAANAVHDQSYRILRSILSAASTIDVAGLLKFCVCGAALQ